MKLSTSAVISGALLILQGFAQLKDDLPDEWKHFALLAHVIVEAALKMRVHHFNTDGTPQEAPFISKHKE